MKKLLVLALVLSMAAMANANLSFTIGGVEGPDEITVNPSDNLVLGIWGSEPAESQPTPYIIVQGPGAIQGGVVLYDPTSALIKYSDAEALIATYWAPMTMEEALAFISDPEAGWGYVGATDFSYAEIISDKTSSIPATIGLLVNDIGFHCEGLGDVTVTLMTSLESGIVTFDTLVIHQIPEPITMGLLGLGGLFLRRRK